MRRVAVGIGVLAAGVTAWAASSTGTIDGYVASQGKPLAGATCQAAGARATSDANGRFKLVVPAGRTPVTCRKSGYGPANKKGTWANVEAGKSVSVRVMMMPLAPQLEPKMAEEAEVKPMAPSRPEPRKRDRGPRRRPMVKRKMSISGRVSRPRPIMIAADAPPPPEMSREGYDKIDENPFKAAIKAPLSTFSIDVDTASYANVRRFLDSSKRPPKDAVKIEELINYFTYDYPQPDGPHPFSVTSEVSVAPWNPAHRLVHIGLQGKSIDAAKLPPSNLVFLMDVSGSMNNANKLPLLKQAFRLLVNNLKPEDTVAIVVYAGAAGLVLPPTGGKQRGKILDAIENLRAGGSTAGGAGIQLAYQIAQEKFIKGGNNRVILATDGDFNVGTSSDADLVRLIEEKRKSGVFLTVLGFGRGNYQDAKMEKLADKGNGNHAYIDSILEAKKVLVSEMGGTLFTIAKDVKIQVEFNPAKVKGYRLIGYENRKLANEDFNDDKKDAGELGAGHTVTVLYEIIPAGSDEALPGVDALKYQATQISEAAKKAPEMMTVKLRYKKPDGDKSTLLSRTVVDDQLALEKTSDNFRFSAAVAGFGMLLRDSKHKGNLTWKDVVAWAKGAQGEDAEGYRFEFLKLAQKAELLK